MACAFTWYLFKDFIKKSFCKKQKEKKEKKMSSRRGAVVNESE